MLFLFVRSDSVPKDILSSWVSINRETDISGNNSRIVLLHEPDIPLRHAQVAYTQNLMLGRNSNCTAQSWRSLCYISREYGAVGPLGGDMSQFTMLDPPSLSVAQDQNILSNDFRPSRAESSDRWLAAKFYFSFSWYLDRAHVLQTDALRGLYLCIRIY